MNTQNRKSIDDTSDNSVESALDYLGQTETDEGSADESLIEEFDLGGLTKEEVRQYNRIAPVGQRLQDVMGDGEEEEEEEDQGGDGESDGENGMWVAGTSHATALTVG